MSDHHEKICQIVNAFTKKRKETQAILTIFYYLRDNVTLG